MNVHCSLIVEHTWGKDNICHGFCSVYNSHIYVSLDQISFPSKRFENYIAKDSQIVSRKTVKLTHDPYQK